MTDEVEVHTKIFRGNNDIKLVGDAYGDPSADPVLFLHGGGQTRHAWGGAARTLAQAGWYVVTLDQRGHGESDWAKEKEHYAVDNFTADIRAVAATFDKLPAFVGASMGGGSALTAQGESAEQICSALVLVDVTPRVETKGVQRIMDFMTQKPEGFETLEEVADAIAAYTPNRKRTTNLAGLEKNLRQLPNGRYRWHWDPDMLGIRFAERMNFPDRLADAARNIKVPTLLVRGQQSDVVSMEGANEFLELVPHAKFVDVKDAGHMVAGDQNDIFTNAVLDFLGNI